MTATANILRHIFVVAVLFITGLACSANNLYESLNINRPDSVKSEIESLFPEKSQSLFRSHFTWGVEIGSSIDLRGNNMSSFDLDVMFGYKNDFLRTVGIGVGVHRAFGNKNTFIPIYALIRTSFRKKPSLFFLNLKAGYSINNIANGITRGGFTGTIGLGINLAMSSRFQSHIILSYNYFQINTKTYNEQSLPNKYVDLARISLGVNF